jgi:hypothetical protein
LPIRDERALRKFSKIGEIDDLYGIVEAAATGRLTIPLRNQNTMILENCFIILLGLVSHPSPFPPQTGPDYIYSRL